MTYEQVDIILDECGSEHLVSADISSYEGGCELYALFDNNFEVMIYFENSNNVSDLSLILGFGDFDY